MVRRTSQGVTVATGAVAAALLLAACGTGAPSAGLALSAEDRERCTSSTTAATLQPFRGPASDYDPLQSPDELARQSRLIVSGTVAAVREGRTTVYPASSAGIEGPTSLVLVIADVTAVSGQRQAGHDGNVYVELQATNGPDPASHSRALPAGAGVVAFLVPASDGAPDSRTDVSIANPSAGRPADQALYLPAGPQGLAVQAAGNVVWPLIGAQAPGCVADTLPGGHLIGQ